MNYQKKVYHVFDNSIAALKAELEQVKDELELFDDSLRAYSNSPTFEREYLTDSIEILEREIKNHVNARH